MFSFLLHVFFSSRIPQMATTAWTPSRSTTGLPPSHWLAPTIQPNCGVKPPRANSEYPQACPSPTSTQLSVVRPTLACTSTEDDSSWAQAAAPSSCVSVSCSSVPPSATRVPSWTRSATAAPAATRTLTRTARPQRHPRHTIRTRPRRIRTWRDLCRSACRLTCDNNVSYCNDVQKQIKHTCSLFLTVFLSVTSS